MKQLNAYLIFNGNCREAMEYYQECLGGVLYTSPYSAAPDGDDLPDEYKNWVIHARLTIKHLVLMASDTRPGLPVTQGNNFFISLSCENEQEAKEAFGTLGLNGTIDMPLQETFFAIRFGMLTDQFGIKWMINYEKPLKLKN